MKLTVESKISNRLPFVMYTLLTEIAKVCKVDIWVTTPNEEIEVEVKDEEVEDYSWGV